MIGLKLAAVSGCESRGWECPYEAPSTQDPAASQSAGSVSEMGIRGANEFSQ